MQEGTPLWQVGFVSLSFVAGAGLGTTAQINAPDAAHHRRGADTAHQESVASRFSTLAENWRQERRRLFSSNFLRMITLPSYQRIIALGWDAVPSILQDLQRTSDSWGYALGVITEENPVPVEARGDARAIARAWLSWGQARHLIS